LSGCGLFLRKNQLGNSLWFISVFDAWLQRDTFFILACDGLWRVFDNAQAVDFVSSHVQKQKQEEEAGLSRDSADVAMALVREAIRGRQALDNVSAVVVMLKW
jgi:serine/threonine protein phosphatase PrpC